MKLLKLTKWIPIGLGASGSLYGLAAVVLVYRDSPFHLQAGIVAGVMTVGLAMGAVFRITAGWLRSKNGVA